MLHEKAKEGFPLQKESSLINGYGFVSVVAEGILHVYIQVNIKMNAYLVNISLNSGDFVTYMTI